MLIPWVHSGAFATAVALSIILLSFGVLGASNDSLLWGPYRSNLYFGVRPRIPQSLTTALLWARVEDPQSVQESFRWTCEQTDAMAGYGWEEYDARKGGRQVMHDAANNIDLTTEFVKIPGGSHGGNWGVRISAKPRPDAVDDVKTTVMFAIGMEGSGHVTLSEPQQGKSVDGDVEFHGQSPGLGEFKLVVTKGPSTNAHPSVEHEMSSEKPLDKTIVSSLQVPQQVVWASKHVIMQGLKEEIDLVVEKYGEHDLPPPWQLFTLPNGKTGAGTMQIVQKVFEGPFEFDILFSSSSSPDPMTSAKLTSQIESTSKDFDSHFSKIFKPNAPFDKSTYSKFSKSLFSNLLGGIGYFYGDARIDTSYAIEYEEENDGFWHEAAEAKSRNQASMEGPYELFTAVPSRPFFPRGFLWDEGFHLLQIVEWDADLALQILQSWLNLMDNDGWIAREQILGQEARSKVPPEFQIQYPHYANPPTLFLVLDRIVELTGSKHIPSDQKQTLKSYLRELYPLLTRHYFWYRKTQKGDIKSYDRTAFSAKEGYRWRGRTLTHTLTSGLDDYPRAQPPHPGELHVDLLCWIGVMTRSMKSIAALIGEKDDVLEYAGYENAIVRNLDDLHWDDAEKTFCDASIDLYEENTHVCHKGYISIFPFVTGMLEPDSPRLGPILNLLANPEELWSPHGIRSLSKRDEYYGTGENYWRGPVWMNINYLVLSNLRKVAQSKKGPHQKKARDLYNKLRRNLVNTVYESWEETGFAWEQYNPDTGAGQRNKHFTGWTSLIVNIMCMPELSGDESTHVEL